MVIDLGICSCGMRGGREESDDAAEEKNSEEFPKGVQKQCGDTKGGPQEEVQKDDLFGGPSGGDKAVVEMFAGCASMKRGVSRDDASGDDDEAVSEWDPKGQECCGDFSSCVDGENAEHETKEHRSGISHEDTRKLKIEN